MKTIITLICLAFTLGAAAQHKYFLESGNVNFNYVKRKIVPFEDRREYTLKVLYPDGSEGCASMLGGHCVTPGGWLLKKELSWEKSPKEPVFYHMDIVFKKLEMDHSKRERKKDASGIRLYYYSVPVSAVYEVTMTDKDGNIVMKEELSNSKNVEFPTQAKPAVYHPEILDKEYAAVEWSPGEVLYQFKDDFSNNMRALMTKYFQTDKEYVGIRYNNLRTKDPEFQELIATTKKLEELMSMINESNRQKIQMNWYTEAIAVKADEILKTLVKYQDPVYASKFTDPKEKLEFEYMMRGNVMLLKLLSSDVDGAKADHDALKKDLAALKQKGTSFRDIDRSLEQLQPIISHEIASRPTNKPFYNYYR